MKIKKLHFKDNEYQLLVLIDYSKTNISEDDLLRSSYSLNKVAYSYYNVPEDIVVTLENIYTDNCAIEYFDYLRCISTKGVSYISFYTDRSQLSDINGLMYRLALNNNKNGIVRFNNLIAIKRKIYDKEGILI